MGQVRVSCPACRGTLTLTHPWLAGTGSSCPYCLCQFALPESAQFAEDTQSSWLGGDSQSDGPPAQLPGEPEEGSKLLWVILAASGGLIGTLLVLVMVAISDDRGVALENAAAPAVATPAVAELASPSTRSSSQPLQPERYDELDRLVAELGSGQLDVSRKNQALETLLKKQFLNAERAPVLKAVEPLMLDSNPWLRRNAIAVAGAWGGKETVPMLVALLVQLDPGIRRSAIESLGQIKDASAAEALAPLMTNSSDRHSAMQALESLGEIAEPAVLKLLNHSDNDVRFDVCRVLGKIGGRNSVAAMKNLLLRERDHRVKFGAELALRDLGKKGL